MNDQVNPPVPSLRAAIRTARVEGAERSQAVAEVRGAELARLEMLHDDIQPVLAQIPAGIDLFDCGLVPGQHPRLFIDMIAFVEMARDKRHYRFVQDTRHGRITLAESDKLAVMTEAITAYIARRLVDREKALAGSKAPEETQGEPLAPARMTVPAPRRVGWVRRAGLLVLEYLGIIALCVLAMVLVLYACGYELGAPR